MVGKQFRKVIKMTTKSHDNLITSDHAEDNKISLKEKLAITLIHLIRAKCWTQIVASEILKVSQPRISNLMCGKVDRFSVDSLLEMIFLAGYSFDYLFDYSDNTLEPRLELRLKKAIL